MKNNNFENKTNYNDYYSRIFKIFKSILIENTIDIIIFVLVNKLNWSSLPYTGVLLQKYPEKIRQHS